MRAAQSWLDHRDFSREVVEGAWGQEQGEATVRLAHTVAAPVREGSGVMHTAMEPVGQRPEGRGIRLGLEAMLLGILCFLASSQRVACGPTPCPQCRSLPDPLQIRPCTR